MVRGDANPLAVDARGHSASYMACNCLEKKFLEGALLLGEEKRGAWYSLGKDLVGCFLVCSGGVVNERGCLLDRGVLYAYIA